MSDFKIKTMKIKGKKFKVEVPLKELTLEQVVKRGRKIMKKYQIKKKATFRTCGTHKPNICYIEFKKLPKGQFVSHSDPRDDCVVDYDKKGEIVGMEFYDGLPLKLKKKK